MIKDKVVIFKYWICSVFFIDIIAICIVLIPITDNQHWVLSLVNFLILLKVRDISNIISKYQDNFGFTKL